MLSARAGEEARIEGLQAGADDYLVKPFSARELLARIDAQIRLARARSAVEAERRRFYSFLAQAPVAIAVFEGRGLTIAYANDAGARAAGRRARSSASRCARRCPSCAARRSPSTWRGSSAPASRTR